VQIRLPSVDRPLDERGAVSWNRTKSPPNHRHNRLIRRNGAGEPDVRRSGGLPGHAAGDARAAAAQWGRLIGIIIAAGVDHDGVPFDSSDGEMRCRDRLRRFAIGVDGQYRHVALMAFAHRSEMFAGIRRIEMAARRHASRGLAIRAGARTAIGIGVNMESVVARRQLGELWSDLQA
jgi:hypothetical protein